MVWTYTSVDTMKDSMDTCFPTSNQLTSDVIAQGVNLCATLNVTHITVDVYYDYADYMTMWVQAVRTAGKNVWFRCHWNAWQGNNGVSASLTPAQYITNTQAFITSNPTLFADGDIFDACPEPDNSSYWNTTYGAGWTNGAPTTATNAFNQFLLDLDTQLQSTLNSVGVYGVNTKIRSLNSFWAKSIAALYPSTVKALGYVCLDSYPEASSTDPTTCANARLAELQLIAAARPGVPIVISEMGYSNSVTVTDANQQAVLAAELAAIATVPTVVGVNYWVAQGTETSGGHTHLFAGNRGAWTLRPAAYTLSQVYLDQLHGWVDTSGISTTIGGVSVTLEPDTLNITNAIGQRSTCNFSVQDVPGQASYQQGQPVIISVPINGNTTRLFGGVIATSKRVKATLGSYLVHEVQCADWHYLADKRVAATSYANQTCGFMVRDLVANYLAAEGVTYQRGVNQFTAQQSDVEASDMSSFSPGASVTISQDTTQAWHGSGSLKVVTSGGAHTFEQLEIHTSALGFSASQQVTISFYGWLASGTATVRYFLQSDTGAIGTAGNITLTTTKTRFTVTQTLPNPFVNVWIGLRVDTGSVAQAITFWMDGMQIEVGATASAWELGGLQQTVQDGPIVTPYTIDYKPVSVALDELAQYAGFYWQIDANKVLWFAAHNTLAAPWIFDGSQDEAYSLAFEETNPLYRNAQWMLGAKEVTSSQTEIRNGDGNTRAFTMSYSLHSVPTISVSRAGGAFTAATVGIRGVDTGKDFYWSHTDAPNVITQDTSGTVLAAAGAGGTPPADQVKVIYVGEYPVVVYSEDNGALSTELSVEGSGTGLVEAVAVDTGLVTSAQAFQSAAALLNRYATQGEVMTFQTYTNGLAPGQLLTTNIGAPWNISNQQHLLESVTIRAAGLYLLFDIKGLQGPVNTNWVTFFSKLANQQSVIDTTTAGQQQTVAILQTGSVTWTWTVTGTTQVNSLLIPSASLFPSATLFPGTAGTPVAITWTKPNVALNAMRDVLSGANPNGLKVGYFAWGTSTQGTPSTATKLANEVGRKPITSMPNGASVGESLINGYLGPQDAVGVAITEVAFFAGAGASATRDSGTMLLYGLYSHTHTASESIQFQADSQLS